MTIAALWVRPLLGSPVLPPAIPFAVARLRLQRYSAPGPSFFPLGGRPAFSMTD